MVTEHKTFQVCPVLKKQCAMCSKIDGHYYCGQASGVDLKPESDMTTRIENLKDGMCPLVKIKKRKARRSYGRLD